MPSCYYCGEYGTTRDHVHPKSRGGEDVPWNMVWACHECNQDKKNHPIETYREIVARRFGVDGQLIFPGDPLGDSLLAFREAANP